MQKNKEVTSKDDLILSRTEGEGCCTRKSVTLRKRTLISEVYNSVKIINLFSLGILISQNTKITAVSIYSCNTY